MAKQLDQIQIKNQQNINNVDNLQRYNITVNADSFNKKFVELPLLTNYRIKTSSYLNTFTSLPSWTEVLPFPPNTVAFEFRFNDMPDWVIPMIAIIPIFSLDDSSWRSPVTPDDFLMDVNFNYFWEKKDNKNYVLYVYVYGDMQKNFTPYNNVNLNINLSGWFINKNYRNTTQHNLGSY